MRIGLVAAAFFSVVAMVIFVIEGPPPENLEITIQSLVILYVSGGLITGAIAGLLAPVARHWAGAMLVGVIGAIPLSALALITLDGTAQWTRTSTEVIVVWSLVVGSLVGLGLWHATKDYS